jgi:hypothetical protein
MISTLGSASRTHRQPLRWSHGYETESHFWRSIRWRKWADQDSFQGTRELIEYPYIIVYRVNDRLREVNVLAIFHGAQSRAR